MTRHALAGLLAFALVACAPAPAPRPGSYHDSDADLTVTRIAHAGVLLDLGGTRLLVDPWLYEGVFERQREALGIHPDALPAASAVLVTGDGTTRFDAAALRRFARSVPRVIAPPALHARLTELGFRQVVALRWWQDTEFDGLQVMAIPADGNGYLIRHGALTVCLTGDERGVSSPGEVRRFAGSADVVLVPIGGRRVFGVRTETDPDEAAEIAAALGARRVIPIGYGAAGTFPFVTFLGDPVTRFREAAHAAGIGPEQIVVLESGESWHLYRHPD